MTSSTAAKSVRDRLIDAAEVCLRAKGIRVDDGVRGRRGGPGVTRLAVPALPGQGVAAGCGDRAAQRGVLVGGARDARAHRGSRPADRRGRGARPNRLRRSRRAADEAADGGARGVRGVRRCRRAGAGARPGRLLAALSGRGARTRRDPPGHRYRRSVGVGGPRDHLAGHGSGRHLGPERSGSGAHACAALRDAGPEADPATDFRELRRVRRAASAASPACAGPVRG